MALLEIRDLVAGYGDAEIVHGVSMEVEEEEIVCVVGPNGAGKSTLMKAVFGILEPWSGVVSFEDRDVTRTPPEQKTRLGMSYVPQTQNLFPSLTVEENLEMGAYVLEDDADVRIQEVYRLFPVLEERGSQRSGSMSGGQQQMLAMGRALMAEPSLLMVDEPSAGLAPELVDEVFDKIEDVVESGTSVLMVEQNARKALRRSDRGYVLEGGEKRFEDAGSALLENPEVEELYLGG